MGYNSFNANRKFATADRHSDGWVPRDVTDAIAEFGKVWRHTVY